MDVMALEATPNS